MILVQNGLIRLAVADDGLEIVLEDIRRGCAWRLAPSHRTIRQRGAGDRKCPMAVNGSIPMPSVRLPPGQAERRGTAIITTHRAPGGDVRFVWRLADDHVAVTLKASGDELEFVALPGPFFPGQGRAEALIPVYQGVLLRGTREFWEESVMPGGHNGWSMAMGATLGESGGLLVTQESPTDWLGARGQCREGPFFVFQQRRCPVSGWYPREVRLYPVDRDITGVAKRYRRRVIERGEFVSWHEKIARKPILEQLFGALIAFTGYNHAPDVDYVESARRLRAHGFETVLYYPTRMWQYSLDFEMGGDAPIWLSDAEIARLKEIPGALLSPWGWCCEGLDDGSERMRGMFRHDERGAAIPHWRIGDKTWYMTCTPYQLAEVRRRYETDMREMDWIHYDVGAMNLGLPCFNTSHELHACCTMSRREDMGWTRELLGAETNGNRIVSAEGFVDRYTVSYDIGSTKLLPAWGDVPSIPVPLTMLVFHDSTVHDWWEVHNYNENPGFALAPHRLGATGSGAPEKKAAMDALYGCPPNLFPFGKQYAWADWETRRTFSFGVDVEDEPVQRAIRAALPVASLHKQIGRFELVSFDPATPDFAVQTTQFSDGTRIVANVSDEDRETSEFGRIQANSWLTLR